MSITGVGGLGGPAHVQRNTPNQFSEMSSEEFIRIMFTELTNQDPLEPTDSTTLLQQLSSLRSIESDMQLTDQLKSLVMENQLAAAGNLMGKFIGGLNENNDRVAGFAVAVSREGDSIKIELDDGWMIPIENVEMIVDPDIFSDKNGDNNDNNDNNNDNDEPDDNGDEGDTDDENGDGDDEGNDESDEDDDTQ